MMGGYMGPCSSLWLWGLKKLAANTIIIQQLLRKLTQGVRQRCTAVLSLRKAALMNAQAQVSTVPPVFVFYMILQKEQNKHHKFLYAVSILIVPKSTNGCVSPCCLPLLLAPFFHFSALSLFIRLSLQLQTSLLAQICHVFFNST